MTMHITQFGGIGYNNVVQNPNTEAVGHIQAAARMISSETITLSGSNQQSDAFSQYTRLVRVAVEVSAWVSISSNPDATASPRAYMPAGAVEYFSVEPGQMIAGITA